MFECMFHMILHRLHLCMKEHKPAHGNWCGFFFWVNYKMQHHWNILLSNVSDISVPILHQGPCFAMLIVFIQLQVEKNQTKIKSLKSQHLQPFQCFASHCIDQLIEHNIFFSLVLLLNFISSYLLLRLPTLYHCNKVRCIFNTVFFSDCYIP